MRAADGRGSRREGIALLLALLVLVVVALFAALLLDAALQESRRASGGVSASLAQAALESALAATLDTPEASGDPTAAGAARDSAWSAAGVSTFVSVQSLGGSLRRVVATATAGAGEARAVAGAVAYLRVATDSASAGGRRLRPVTGWWWAPVP